MRSAPFILFFFLIPVLLTRADGTPRPTPLGPGIPAKSDGIFFFSSPAHPSRVIVEQSWLGDARIWRYSAGRWSPFQLYKGLGQCFSPLIFDFDGSSNYVLYVGSWEHSAGIYQIPLSKRLLPFDSLTTIPESSTCGRILCLRAAPARGDGRPRLYVASEGPGGGLYEFTKIPGTSAWSFLKIHTGSVGEFAIGDARADGITRIYAGDRAPTGLLYEFSWKTNAWLKSILCPALTNILTVAIGDGRGDGINRLYVNAANASWEISFLSNTWHALRIGRPGSRYYIVPARTPAGPRVYSSLQASGPCEWLWRKTGWHEQSLDAITSATGGIAVGDARGDGVPRLYIANGNRRKTGAVIWEIPLPTH
ncbi:MAG: hypothetical protein N2595_08255 [bacterium]|nr:hypothetical protein [bacterium]